mmetsp:Transcript_2361/g.5464  ORF Transcript_2361/g.5464 Transcript_2361/m.5464 type:complete len:104 (-) Transcript_2361:40-351(-)
MNKLSSPSLFDVAEDGVQAARKRKDETVAARFIGVASVWFCPLQLARKSMSVVATQQNRAISFRSALVCQNRHTEMDMELFYVIADALKLKIKTVARDIGQTG